MRTQGELYLGKGAVYVWELERFSIHPTHFIELILVGTFFAYHWLDNS